MLAKQVWRLHTNPNSLIARCFKAKYYPQMDILQAPTGNYRSYAWRSMQNSIWIILKGSCWRIGDGNSVRIWRDNWIPFHQDFKVLSTELPNSNYNLVKGFILSDNPSWDTEALHSQLLPTDYNLIEQIPLINTSKKDSLMWMYE